MTALRPHDTNPNLTNRLRLFFDAEIENYATACQNGDLRPWEDGYVPTLGSAVDSWMQAPRDVLCDWLGILVTDDNSGWDACDELMHLTFLVLEYGGDTLLSRFVP